MRTIRLLSIALALFLAFSFAVSAQERDTFTLEQVLSAPFPANLIASDSAPRLAWSLDQQGLRNLFVAEGPAFTARQLTSFALDDGAELSQLRFSPDASQIVFVRGEGKNSSGQYANPTSNPKGAEQAVWIVPFAGGEARRIDAGRSPAISSTGNIAYSRDGQMYVVAQLGSGPSTMVAVRGKNEPVSWSPDGKRLLFVSGRGDHSFIGVYDPSAVSVQFLAPSVDTDSSPVWSPDGADVAFVRQPALRRDTPDGYFIQPDRPHPWAIWVANVSSGFAAQIWESASSLEGSYPYMAEDTGGVIQWAAGNNILFASEQDGWQHLYALPVKGGAPKLLTPGNCEVEQWNLSPDKSQIIFNSNCDDIDRRHVWTASLLTSNPPVRLTTGEGIEWSPLFLNDGKNYAFLGSDARNTGQVFRSGDSMTSRVLLGESTRPTDFPAKRLVVPQQVVFKSLDGLELHGQLFLPRDLKPGQQRPAVIFLHGGPMRQMLLGWHYMYYYSNAYGMNQYLANLGYVVLAVNYRSGIGYGRAFREAAGRAGRGASEYQDVVAAGKFLQARPDVNPAKIGLWGGSYGGYLTALGLARDSALFAAGVDLHGVHDWPTDNWEGKNISPELTKLAHESSPVSYVDTWISPVLFIHGDDDRNVIFSQTVDLIARLRPKQVHVELLVFPDDVHDFLLHANWLKAYTASSSFFAGQLPVPAK